MSGLSVIPQANRPAAMGVNGMATSAHPLASLAGVRMMMAGGNAFDAAYTRRADWSAPPRRLQAR